MRKFLSLLMMAMFSVAIFAATETTVYYTASEATIGTKTVKLNINRQGDADNWQQYNMTLTELTYNGDPVYTYTYTDLYDGVGKMQFQLYDGDNWVSEKEAISSWTSVGEYNGKMYVHATEQWVAAPGAAGDGDQMYVWNGIGVTTAEAATELGGAAEAVQESGTNIVVGASQKGNWCLKANKGFTSGKFYLGIAMNNGVNAGDTIKIAYFRTTESSTYVLGMDFSADKTSAATTYQILSTSDPQVLASNGTPTDESFIVPEGVANAKYMRIYRNSGSTGLWVAKVEVVKKAGETPEQPEQPEENVLPVVKLAGSLTSWEEPVLMANAEDSLSASVTLNLGIDHYQLKVVSDGNWLSRAGEDDLFTMHRDYPHVDHLNLINTGDNIKLITDVEGAYTFTWTYADSTLVVTFPEAPAKPNYYLIGDSAFVVDAGATADKAWTPDAIASFNDTTILNLKAGVDYIMRLSLNGTWENHRDFRHLTDTAAGLIELPDEYQNRSIGFRLNEAGPVTIIYIPAAEEQPEVFKLIGDFYVAPAPDPTASVRLEIMEWNETPFELAADKQSASLTIEDIHHGNYAFKMFINGEWRSNAGTISRENPTAIVAGNEEGNMTLKADVDGSYTFTWFFANDSLVALFPEKPVVPMTEIRLVPGVWNVDGAKFAAVTWNEGEVMEDGVVSDWFVGTDTVVGNIPAAADSIGFARFNGEAAAPSIEDQNIIWNHTDKMLIDKEAMIYTITGWPEEGKDYCPGYWGEYVEPVYVLENGYYLVGNFSGVDAWSVEDLSAEKKFAANPDNEAEYQLAVNMAENDQVKVAYVENDQIIYWYPKGDNYTVDHNHAGSTMMYFRPDYFDDWNAFGGYFYIVPTSTVDITNVDANAPAVKIIRDGQLFIIKGEKMYNVMGQIIK